MKLVLNIFERLKNCEVGKKFLEQAMTIDFERRFFLKKNDDIVEKKSREDAVPLNVYSNILIANDI